VSSRLFVSINIAGFDYLNLRSALARSSRRFVRKSSHLICKLSLPLGHVVIRISRKYATATVSRLRHESVHESLPDKVGARIIITYRSDLTRVVGAVKGHFASNAPDDKVKDFGIDKVGYQSLHLDNVRLQHNDPGAIDYAPTPYWVELQVRTLAQHLWAEMSHDSFYKNDAMISDLLSDTKRRVNLMSGQIEVADREFDRLNSELPAQATAELFRTLEAHYYTFSSRKPDVELSIQVLKASCL
jgi:ppGpp synthetase/RelA/SpoT-type nucleotidyltranferase